MKKRMHLHHEEANALKICDLVIRNARLVNVLSGEIEDDVDIAICGDEIVGVGCGYKASKTIDAHGRFVYPGFIDAHIHLESTKLSVQEAARLMAPCGTAAVITDPHEIGNVAGLEGLEFQRASAQNNDYIDVFFVAPSCVPTLSDPTIETAPATLDGKTLRDFANHEDVVGLGEVMNVPGILTRDPSVIEKITEFQKRGLVIDGHAPLLSGANLNACVYAGIQSDHESTQLDEAREKLRRGMVVMIREGSSEKNLDALLPLVNGHNTMRLMFASDDLDPSDLKTRGHINHLVRRTVAAGIDPICAIQMATLSPALYFGLQKRYGAIFAGAAANLVIAQDLQEFQPDIVLHQGRVVFENHQLVPQNTHPIPTLHNTMRAKFPALEQLAVKAENGKKIRVIELVPEQILTREIELEPQIENHHIVPDPKRDIAKVCVFERHRESGAFAVGFVRGFGIQRGAFGSSVSHDSHHLIVVGSCDEDILKCAQIIQKMKGGQAAVCAQNQATLPLPIAGLMSPKDADCVIQDEKNSTISAIKSSVSRAKDPWPPSASSRSPSSQKFESPIRGCSPSNPTDIPRNSPY